jgi:hypothetical protein
MQAIAHSKGQTVEECSVMQDDWRTVYYRYRTMDVSLYSGVCSQLLVAIQFDVESGLLGCLDAFRS